MISSNGHQFGDTSLTKVFVGGLAWETPNDALREHFQQYGDILEAVIISDKLTSRSKGYGFVTFKEAEAAAKACQDAAPVINGRRANCNLASLGAKLLSSSPHPPQLQNNNVTMTTPQGLPMPSTTTTTKSTNNTSQVGWYYPARTMPYPSHHHQPIPYYGFSPVPAAFVATNMNYNQVSTSAYCHKSIPS
ncbi:unnamed protein product [Rhodiola kirilowii]